MMGKKPLTGTGGNGGGDGRMMERVRSLSDMVMAFFEEELEGPPPSFLDEEDNSDNDDGCVDDDRKAYWESQHQLLQMTLSRTSSLESKIRRETEKALKELASPSMDNQVCSCCKTTVKECRICTMRLISNRLRNAGYDCALCNSKWRSSHDVPAGEHTYLDVVHNSAIKKEPVRVVIELHFRSEFEMARAREDYDALVARLPEVFVGKPEKLRGVVKIVCGAAKKCMKDNKMHMAPWRKHKYMLLKWFGATSERGSKASTVGGGEFSSDRKQPAKPRASMLTFDLLEKLPGLHCTAVEVV